jgi:hypothetical protein
MFNRVKSFAKKALVVAGTVVATATSALADTGVVVDYSGAVTGITSQITTALTAALPIMGIVLGIYVGVKIFKRFSK